MVISVEHGIQKTFLFILSVILLALALYPLVLPSMPSIKIFDPQYTNYLIVIITIILLITVIKLKRPRIY
ncbi:MAG: hypothetical protein ABIB47_06020 [Candidatus Woesearchaeota archaeon]